MCSWYSVASTLEGRVKRNSLKFVHISDLLPFLRKSREGKEIGLWNYIFYDLTRFSSGLDRVTLHCFGACSLSLILNHLPAPKPTNEGEPLSKASEK